MKIIANKESYGFMGRLWIKGESAEIDKDEKYPKEHFDVLEENKELEIKKPEAVKPKPKK